jgi:hypothetical protein
LTTYDIISSRKENISGHFNLFKNTPDLNLLYKQVPDYKSLFEQERFMWFDEHVLSNFLKDTLHPYKIKWDTILCNQEKGIDSWQGYYLDNWLWKEGRLFELKKGGEVKEVMYLHFISWKRKMKYCYVKYPNDKFFYISYDGLHLKKHSILKLKINEIKNKIYGFWFREKTKAILKKYTKRIKRKLTNI